MDESESVVVERNQVRDPKYQVEKKLKLRKTYETALVLPNLDGTPMNMKPFSLDNVEEVSN